MWDPPGPGTEPMSPAKAGTFLTTGAPGKSQLSLDWQMKRPEDETRRLSAEMFKQLSCQLWWKQDLLSGFFSSVQSFSCVWLFATPWTAARQASLSITNYQSLLKLMSFELVMPSNCLILCPPLLLPPVFPSIRVFSSQHQESVLRIRWPECCSFSFSISPSNEYSGLISFRMDWLDLLAVQGTLKSSPTQQLKSISSSVLSFLYSPTLTSIHDYWKNHSSD